MHANHPPSQQQRLLHYLPEYRVLVCRECKYAVTLHGLDYHLRTVHHIRRQEKQALLDYASTLDLAPLEDIPLPDPSTPPLPSLSQTQGFKCMHCRFACTSQEYMYKHVNKEHQLGKADGPHWEAKTVQTFFKRRDKMRYFVVTPTTTTTNSSGSSSSGGIGSDEWTSRVDRIISELVHQEEQQEQERRRRFAVLEGTTQRAENSAWLRYTRWADLFDGLDIKKVGAMGAMPARGERVDDTTECTFSQITSSVERVLKRCKDNVVDCGRSGGNALLLRWLSSPGSDAQPKPFDIHLSSDTHERYASYWKRFLSYCLREKDAAKFTSGQWEQRAKIMAERDSESLDQLVFSFSIDCLTQKTPGRPPSVLGYTLQKLWALTLSTCASTGRTDMARFLRA